MKRGSPADIARRVIDEDILIVAGSNGERTVWLDHNPGVEADLQRLAQALLDAEATIERLREARESEAEFRSRAETRVAEATDIIEELRDIQNGCPLPTWQAEFDAINVRADAFVGRGEVLE